MLKRSMTVTVMLTLRAPISLRARLRGAAKGDHRSVNELLWRALRGESSD